MVIAVRKFIGHRTSTKDLVKQLRANNVNLNKVYNIVGNFLVQPRMCLSQKWTLRNLCGRISRDQADDDVHKTLAVFKEMQWNDPEFTYRVRRDEESRIKRDNYVVLCANFRSSESHGSCNQDGVTRDCAHLLGGPDDTVSGARGAISTRMFFLHRLPHALRWKLPHHWVCRFSTISPMS